MPDLSITSEGRLPGLHADPRQRLEQACRQFEQAFLTILMKREDLDDDPLLDGDPATRQYKDLLNSGLSEKAAGSLGIADLLMRELGTRAQVTGTGSALKPGGGLP
jgi:Rod binding domain-containing protein